MVDGLVALWIAIGGAAFVASPFVAAAFPGAFEMLEVAGRCVYAVALALCVVVLAVRLTRSIAPRGRRTGTRP